MGSSTIRESGHIKWSRCVIFKNKLQNSIGYRFVTYILLFSSFAALISTTIQLFFEYRRDISAIEETAAQIENSHKSTIVQALWAYDVVIMETQLQGIKNLPDVAYASIRKESRIIMKTGSQPRDTKVRSYEYPLLHTPAKQTQRRLGTLQVEISLAGVYQRLWDRIVVIFFTQTLKTFIVSIFIFLLFYHIVGRHLKSMAGFAQSIQLNSLDKPLSLNRKPGHPSPPDELGLVESALNNMRANLVREIKNVRDSQDALKKSEERFALAMEASRDGLFDWDLETDEIYYSPGWKRILGYTEDELPNDFSVWEQLTAPGDVERSWNMQKELITRKRERFEMEFKMKHKNGRWVDILSRATAIFDSQGTAVRIVGTHVDITEQKLLQKKLQQSQKMESVGNLAGGIAHDFNNLLYPIIGMSELLLEDLPMGSLERDNAREILRAGKRGRDLVRQILAFSRRSDHKKVPVRIRTVLKEVLKLSRSTIPADIHITHDIRDGCGPVMADPTQIHQVAMNLITNAYHAVARSGGRISVRLEESAPPPEDTASDTPRAKRYTLLKITDNGIGIDATLRDKIFEPYFTTKEKQKGTGLGLAVVYGIVQELGGEILVDTETGQGTCFRVYFPAISRDPRPPDRETPRPVQTGTERILLVDDEEPIVRLEEMMLERLGYQVVSRTNSLVALELFRSDADAFDVVITDMTMPGMTGDILARQMLAIKPDIPIIICTGFSEKLDEVKAARLGIKGFLMKPVIKSELAQTLRTVLDQAQSPTRVS